MTTVSTPVASFPFSQAFTHGAVTIATRNPLTFETPPACWAYAVTVPAVWPQAATGIHDRDGTIRVRLRANGRVSVIAVNRAGILIDEVIVDDAAGELDLVSVPMGACDGIVFRNARTDGYLSHVEVERIDCVDLGPSQPREGDLTPPADLVLRPMDDWPRYYGIAQSLPDRLRNARYARLDHVRTMPWLEGLGVRVHPHDDLSRALYISGLYEPSTMIALQRVLKPGATFIDVGANAGLFSMLASRWVAPEGRVYAFEPSEREYQRLLEHVNLNRLANVIAVREAVSDREGQVRLRVATFPNAGHNTLGESFAYPTVEVERIELVAATTLDRFVATHRLERVDAIKMDIEGGEAAALSGARSVLTTLRPVLIVEVSKDAQAGFGAGATGVIDALRSAEYRCYTIGHASELIPLGHADELPDGNVVAVPLESISA